VKKIRSFIFWVICVIFTGSLHPEKYEVSPEVKKCPHNELKDLCTICGRSKFLEWLTSLWHSDGGYKMFKENEKNIHKDTVISGIEVKEVD